MSAEPKVGSAGTVVLYVRLPPTLKARLAAEAQRGQRALNAEVVRRLELSLDAPVARAIMDERP